MTEIKTIFILITAAAFLFFMCAGAGFTALADTGNYTVQETAAEMSTDGAESLYAGDGVTGGEAPAAGLDGLVAGFTEYLKDRYGEDYGFYYNRIIDQWGSIEGYLLAFGDKLPKEQRTGWDKFVGWLNEYAPVWATVLAVIAVITVAAVVKVKLKKLKSWLTKLIEKLVDKRIEPIENELNAQSKANIALIKSQKALLGNNARFANEVAALDGAEKELKGEQEL